MESLITIIIAFAFIFTGKYLFKTWFNHLSVYSFIWMVMILLYQWRLMPFEDINDLTWFVVLGGSLSLVLGTLTIFVFRGRYLESATKIDKTDMIPVMADGGKVLFYATLVFGIIGMIGAVHDWMALLNKFGSFPNIFLNGNTIYRMRVDYGITFNLPYMNAFAVAGIVLGGIYSGYHGRLKAVSLLPLLANILIVGALFGRSKMLDGLIVFTCSFILTRFVASARQKIKLDWKNVLTVIFILLLVYSSATVIKASRGTIEVYKGQNRSLSGFTENPFFSPSIYFYLCSHFGVLNSYLEEDDEDLKIGTYTLSGFYNFFAKFGLTERVPNYPKGYFMPMWSNTGTLYREIHSDYGWIGVFPLVYLLGLFTTFFWIRFFETGKLFYLAFLASLFLIIISSFYHAVNRGADWYITLFILVVIARPLENIVRRRVEKNSTFTESSNI